MNRKKWLSLLLAAAVMAAAAPSAVFAEEAFAAEGMEEAFAKEDSPLKGAYGSNLNWSIDSKGNFLIEGAGDMPTGEDVPWEAYTEKIKSVTVGEGITGISDDAFFNCENLTEASLPQSLETIGATAFAYCNMAGIALGPNLKTIGDMAFFECGSLKEIEIPQSVTWIGREAFRSCKSLTDVWFRGCPKFKENNTFIKDTVTIHYPYELASGWEAIKESGLGGDPVTFLPYCFEHKWETQTINPSCVAEGKTIKRCSLCGKEEETILPAIGHKYETQTIKATLSQNGSVFQKCLVCGHEIPLETVACPAKITLEKDAYKYTGKAIKPAVTVLDSSGRVIPPSSYTVSYSANKAVGKASVSVVFGGNYSGTAIKTFVISPKGTSLSKLKAKKKGFEIKWKKQASQTSGYQIQYSTSKNFKNAKNIKITKNKTVVKTVSKLKSKTRYFVRIRTYKTVKGVKYSSVWSTVKHVTTK